jgi:D-sedoheptulose 7-phosphate isomerase
MSSVVFTNGCFDLLHAGHIDLLERARALGDRLVVGLNSDSSVRSIKGPGRPYIPEDDRKRILLGLRAVDEVIIFEELTPQKLIERIRPDVLVKGGDWGPDEIVGASFVEASGGKVVSLPLLDGYSSSSLVRNIRGDGQHTEAGDVAAGTGLTEHLSVFERLVGDHVTSIERCAEVLKATFAAQNKVLICGNGGSAADAQHIAAEFVGRYERERNALPAIALTTDTSALTALANDYEFERVYSRQVEALAQPGDCLIAISTSGNSRNVIAAVMSARRLGCSSIALTGASGKKLASLCDAAVMVPSERTSRIQEAHITIAHYWCELLDL